MKFLAVVSCFLFTSAGYTADVDFAHQIVPILRQHCAKCHLGDAKKGGLSLNTRESLLAGSENGVVVEPGKVKPSHLLELLISTDPDERMPPKGDRVSPDQFADLQAWVLAGLPWEPGFTFGKVSYEPPLKPRRPELPPIVEGRSHPVDRLVHAYLKEKKVTRPQPLEDAAFIRRLSLDLIGLLPSPDEVERFVRDSAPNKRIQLITQTLGKDLLYTEHWLTFWNDLLRNDYQGTGYIDGGRKSITQWLYQALMRNEPYDQFARDLLAPPTKDSEGFTYGIQWRGSVNASQVREIQFAQSISQTFLGLNLKCASCHDSFVDRWKLEDAYGLAAIYSDHPLEIARCDKATGRSAQARWIFPDLGEVNATAPQPERLKQLAALMTHPENGRFARTLVNRLWQRLMGRGIVHPVDAMDTAPWNEDLLDYLAVQFVADGYDIKKALALIVSSQAYQSRAVATKNDGNGYVFHGPIAKRMTAEQFLDAVWTLTSTAPHEPHSTVSRGRESSGGSLAARWIWSYAAASESAPVGETITLRSEIDLPEAPAQVRAAFSCDNRCEIFVNDQPAGGSDNWQEVSRKRLNGFKAGRNVVVIVAHNGGTEPGPAALFFQAKLQFTHTPPLIIATDSSWKWTATVPDAKGHFASVPTDWRPAVEVSNQAVWANVVTPLRRALRDDPPEMVRASLVPANPLMRALGRPNREQIVSMRPDNVTTLEAIDLANGEVLADLLRQGAKGLAQTRGSTGDLVESTFRRALSRPPSPEEKTEFISALGPRPTSQTVEDLLWLVLLLPEFQFVR